MKKTYTDILVSIIRDQDVHKQGHGYKYLVEAKQNDGYYYALTAFRTKSGMRKFLKTYDLKFNKRSYTGSNIWSLTGEFSRVLVWDYSEFNKIKKSNPKYILITENGHKTIGLLLDRVLYVMNSNTDPFFQYSLIQGYNYSKCNPDRMQKYYSMFHS